MMKEAFAFIDVKAEKANMTGGQEGEMRDG